MTSGVINTRDQKGQQELGHLIDRVCRTHPRQRSQPQGASGQAYIRVLAETSGSGEINIELAKRITKLEIENQARNERRRRLLQGD